MLLLYLSIVPLSGQQAITWFYATQERLAKNDTAGLAAQLKEKETAYRNDPASALRVQLIKARLLMLEQKGEAGVRICLDAIRSTEKTVPDSLRGLIYLTLGNYYFELQDLPEGLMNFNAALLLLPDDYRNKRLRKLRFDIEMTQYYMGNYSAALPHMYWLRSAEERIGDSIEISRVYNSLGVLHMVMKNHDSAMYYHTRSYGIRSRAGDKNYIGQSLNNLGAVSFERQQYEQALAYFSEGKKWRMEGGTPEPGIIESFINVGKTYYKLRQPAVAKKELLEALSRSNKIKAGELTRRAYEYLIKIYADEGNFRAAYEAQQMFVFLKDSLYGLQKREDVLRMTYNHHRREDSIAEVQRDAMYKMEREKQQMVEDEREKNTRIYAMAVGAVILFLLTLAFVFFRANRQSRKANSIISAQHDALAEKQKEINDSISYARRIQEALLPSGQLLQQLFPEHFIFFRPRDVVSGDFYWAARTGNPGAEKMLIAAADCTGHGVPGAMMSMIGINLLNRIVNEKEISSPEKILFELHKNIITAFSASPETSAVKDGMDIALVCIDPGNKQFSFAGASRPVVLHTVNGQQDIRGDRWSVGGEKDAETPYTLHTFPLKEVKGFYLFSDGFGDQFGGAKGKKFKVKNLLGLLESVREQKAAAQEETVSQAFDDWKKNMEQVDDVLLIGVRLV